jgi:hypothetical protein
MEVEMKYIVGLFTGVVIFAGLTPCAMMAADEIVQQSTRAYGMEATIPEEIASELISRYRNGDDYMPLVDINIDKSKLTIALSAIKNVGFMFTAGGNRQYQYINGRYPKLSDSQTLIGFRMVKNGPNPDSGPGYFVIEKDVATGKFVIVDFDYRTKIDDEKKWMNIPAETTSSDPVNPEKPFTVCHVLQNLDAYSGKIIQISGVWRGYDIEDNCETQLQVAGHKWPNAMQVIATDFLDMWDDPINWSFDSHEMELAFNRLLQFMDNGNATIIGKLEAKWEVFPEGPSLLGYGHLGYYPARIIVKEIKDIEGTRIPMIPMVPIEEDVPIIKISIE